MNITHRHAAGGLPDYQIVEHSEDDNFVELRQKDDHSNRIRIERGMVNRVGERLAGGYAIGDDIEYELEELPDGFVELRQRNHPSNSIRIDKLMLGIVGQGLEEFLGRIEDTDN